MRHLPSPGTDTQGWPEKWQVRQVPRKGELPGNREHSATHDGLTPTPTELWKSRATETIDK